MVDSIRAYHDRARVIATWGKLRWETSRSCELSTDCDGWRITIYKHRSENGFYISVSRNMVGSTQRGRKVYPTVEDAKLNCQEAVFWAIKNMGQEAPETW